MGLFSTGSPFDEDVERVTDEKNTTENWGLIMDICDRAAANPKEGLRSIVRRLNHRSPHVQLQAITLLDACVNNSGKSFHLEVASRDFEQEFRKIALSRNTHRRVSSRLLASLQKWAETEFKSDPQLALIPGLYNSLRQYTVPEEPAEKKQPAASRDPNVVSSQQEEEDIAKAIALSMKEAEKTTPRAASTLYPSASALAAPSTSAASSSGPSAGAEPTKPERKVRALYDFEAAEDNELTFKAGEIVVVTDDSDPNWWLGSNHRGQGLFPSNFVTSDLDEEPEQWKEERQQRKSVQFNEEVEVQEVEQPPPVEPAAVDEQKIGELLHLLNEADPTGERPDSAQLLTLEEQCLAMGPLIDQELERTDRRHAQLTKISADLVDALSLYHQLMREPPAPPAGYYAPPPPPPHVKQYPGYYPGMPQPMPQAYPGVSMPGGMMPPMGAQMPPPPQYAQAGPGGPQPPPPHLQQHPQLDHQQQQQGMPPGMSQPPPGMSQSQPAIPQGMGQQAQPGISQSHTGIPAHQPAPVYSDQALPQPAPLPPPGPLPPWGAYAGDAPPAPHVAPHHLAAPFAGYHAAPLQSGPPAPPM